MEAHERAVDVATLAGTLDVSRDTVYRLIHSGEIPAFKVGAVWRAFPTAVREALAAPRDPWERSAGSAAKTRSARRLRAVS